ncbi:MAG: tetratricopeptide (TPR) repeat protein [Marivirga sp.]|jgi:hypothetical protein
MNRDRIEQLLIFRKETPQDPFLIYALATEYKSEEPITAKEYFDILLNNYPDYVGTYFHAASLYAEHFERSKAEDIYLKGIEKAAQLNDLHALKELKNAYQNFQFEE